MVVDSWDVEGFLSLTPQDVVVLSANTYHHKLSSFNDKKVLFLSDCLCFVYIMADVMNRQIHLEVFIHVEVVVSMTIYKYL